MDGGTDHINERRWGEKLLSDAAEVFRLSGGEGPVVIADTVSGIRVQIEALYDGIKVTASDPQGSLSAQRTQWGGTCLDARLGLVPPVERVVADRLEFLREREDKHVAHAPSGFFARHAPSVVHDLLGILSRFW